MGLGRGFAGYPFPLPPPTIRFAVASVRDNGNRVVTGDYTGGRSSGSVGGSTARAVRPNPVVAHTVAHLIDTGRDNGGGGCFFFWADPKSLG